MSESNAKPETHPGYSHQNAKIELPKSHVCLRKEEIQLGIHVRIVPDLQEIERIQQIPDNTMGLQNIKKLQNEMLEVYVITNKEEDKETGKIMLTLQKVEYYLTKENKISADKKFIEFKEQTLIRYYE